MASMLVAPQVPLLLTTIPGIIRASRLLATIAPRSALPRLVLRVMPAIYFLTTWVPVALVVHAMGNVLLLVGLALFTGQCGCSSTHTATATATNKQTNLTSTTITLHRHSKLAVLHSRLAEARRRLHWPLSKRLYELLHAAGGPAVRRRCHYRLCLCGTQGFGKGGHGRQPACGAASPAHGHLLCGLWLYIHWRLLSNHCCGCRLPLPGCGRAVASAPAQERVRCKRLAWFCLAPSTTHVPNQPLLAHPTQTPAWSQH